MQQNDGDKIQSFKNLLKKMYEKGEKEKNLSTRDIIQDMETELRAILTK